MKNIFRKKKIEISPDENTLAIIGQLKSSIDTVFDVGACHGRFSKKVFQKFPTSKIYAFEPFPDSYAVLKREMHGRNAILNQAAVGKAIGKSIFFVNKNYETNSLTESVSTNSQIDALIQKESEITVDVITIDDYCEKNGISKIDLLKIDVQGNTLEVLKGSEAMLKNRKISIIQCEVEFIEIYKNQKLYHDVATMLTSYNYTQYSLYNLHYDINGRLSWADAIFILKND